MKRIIALLLFLLMLSACGQGPSIITSTTPTAIAPSTTIQPRSTKTPVPLPGSTAQPGGIPSTGAAAGIPNFDHIVLIVLENRDYSMAMDGSSMPHLVDLAQKNVLLTNYFAISHPSVPNYIALMSGSTQNITNDC